MKGSHLFPKSVGFLMLASLRPWERFGGGGDHTERDPRRTVVQRRSVTSLRP
jgi:hypothetical protein